MVTAGEGTASIWEKRSRATVSYTSPNALTVSPRKSVNKEYKKNVPSGVENGACHAPEIKALSLGGCVLVG